MKSFARLLYWDFALQYRRKFWHAGVVVTVLWLGVFQFLPQESKSVWLIPLLFLDTTSFGLMLIAGTVLIERTQGSLLAFSVTPVSTTAWLLSKMASLSVLTLAMALTIVAVHGGETRWILLSAAVLCSAFFNTLLGFVLVCPFKRLTNFFLVFALAMAFINLPILWHFGLWGGGFAWLIPSYPALVLLSSSLGTGSEREYLVALLVLSGWCLLLLYLSRLVFHRFIGERREGRTT